MRQTPADAAPEQKKGGDMAPIPQVPVPKTGEQMAQAKLSQQASLNPRQVRGRSAYDAREEPEYQPDDMDLEIPVYGESFTRQPEEIVIADEEALKKEYADRLAFDRELLTIQIEAPNEENAPQHVPVGVNGKFHYLPVGREIRLPRCFVEVLAAAQPYSVQTHVRQVPGLDPIQTLTRNSRMRYPFVILKDPHPEEGRRWLRRVKQMG